MEREAILESKIEVLEKKLADCELYIYRMGKSLSERKAVGRRFIPQNQRKPLEV
jgi:hypothetical protein